MINSVLPMPRDTPPQRRRISSPKTIYKRALRDAQVELRALYREREELERRIARVRQGVLAFHRLTISDSDPVNPTNLLRRFTTADVQIITGLTEAVRWVLMASTKPLKATQVRDLLESVGFDPGSSQNVMISVHNVLTRLVAKGEVKEVWIKNRTGRPRVSDVAHWWGEHGIPKPWVRYKPKKEQPAQDSPL